MNEPNEESKRRGLEIGTRVFAWGDIERGLVVVGFDGDGDPVLRQDYGSGADLPYLAHDVTRRADAPAPAPLPDTPGFGCVAVDIDRKPYGDKPPMALIPWEVVPNRWRPEPVEGADPDESYLPARCVRVLLEIHGDDLLSDAARAFGHGCAKYGRDTWRASPWEADNGRGRMEYESALYRHLYADQIGEKTDPDSGLPHVAHALASALICAWHAARVAGSK